MHRGPPIIGLVIAVVLYVGLHLYMWARLVRSTELPARWRRAAAIVLVVTAIYMPLAMLLGRALGLSLPPALAWPGALWAGVGLYLILSLVAADVLRWLVELWLWLRRRELLGQPGTQRRLYRVFGGAAALVGLTLSTLGALGAACGPTVRPVEVHLQRLPAAMDGFRVVQISDLHAGRTIGPSYVAHVAEMVAELEPDLLVLTGDLVDGTVPALASTLEPLLRLRPPHGIVYVTGNHEYYAGTGYVGPPMRLGMPSEITELTLRAASAP